MYKPLTSGFWLRAAQTASGWCCFFLMLVPPMPQLHCLPALLSSPAILKSCTRPNPSQEQSFWESIYSDGRKTMPSHLPSPVPLTLPPPSSQESHGGNLQNCSFFILGVLYVLVHTLERMWSQVRGAIPGCQRVWVTYVVSRLQIKARLLWSGARITFEKKSQANLLTGHYWALNITGTSA